MLTRTVRMDPILTHITIIIVIDPTMMVLRDIEMAEA